MLVARGLLEKARDRDTVKGNGTKRKTGRVEAAAESLDGGWRNRGVGKWQRTAVATAVEAHEHHFY